MTEAACPRIAILVVATYASSQIEILERTQNVVALPKYMSHQHGQHFSRIFLCSRHIVCFE
ncbi:hypothetical protein ASC88_28000 [Rhizobacter sp. Root29]|nr:hypothetical protein ASC88_28000 [Rhizobacter sp. Root29]